MDHLPQRSDRNDRGNVDFRGPATIAIQTFNQNRSDVSQLEIIYTSHLKARDDAQKALDLWVGLLGKAKSKDPTLNDNTFVNYNASGSEQISLGTVKEAVS